MDTVWWLCPSLPTETSKWLSSLPILMQESFWWWQCSDRYIISLFLHLHTLSPPPFSPSLISLMVSVDVKHHVYLLVHIRVARALISPHCHSITFFKRCFSSGYREYMSRTIRDGEPRTATSTFTDTASISELWGVAYRLQMLPYIHCGDRTGPD